MRVVENEREGTATEEECRGNVEVFAAVDEVADRVALRLASDDDVGVEGEKCVDGGGDKFTLGMDEVCGVEGVLEEWREKCVERSLVYGRGQSEDRTEDESVVDGRFIVVVHVAMNKQRARRQRGGEGEEHGENLVLFGVGLLVESGVREEFHREETQGRLWWREWGEHTSGLSFCEGVRVEKEASRESVGGVGCGME